MAFMTPNIDFDQYDLENLDWSRPSNFLLDNFTGGDDVSIHDVDQYQTGPWPESSYATSLDSTLSISPTASPTLATEDYGVPQYQQNSTVPPSSPRSSRSSPDASPQLWCSMDQDQRATQPLPRRGGRRAKQHSSTDIALQTTGRLSHTMVERRYRNSINAAIQQLQDALPLFKTTDTKRDASKLPSTKSAVLENALEYIKQLERECEKLRAGNEKMQRLEREDRVLLQNLAVGNSLAQQLAILKKIDILSE